MAGLVLQSQVGRSGSRQNNRLGRGGGGAVSGAHCKFTLSLQTPVQKVNFSIRKDRRDPLRLCKKDTEKQQLNSR